jgi:hypothetical protein
MGYTHYWRQKRAFTPSEWQRITAEAQRICAKAQRGLYAGKEDFVSSTKVETDEFGFRHGFNEESAWRTFPHPEQPTAMQGQSIALAGPDGNGQPEFHADYIGLNGATPQDYESFILERAPQWDERRNYTAKEKADGIFGFTKTEYRAYDAVVVSILAAARVIAPDAITCASDGGDEAIKLMF